MKKAELLVLLIAATVAQAGVRICDVDVYKNVNGWTQRDQFVSQSFTCTADSLLWAEFFVGAANSGGQYHFVIQTPEQQALYYGDVACHTESSYRYVGVNLTPSPSAPRYMTKGKQYILQITLSGAPGPESINYYYSDQNPYKYGHLILPGQDQPPPHEEPYYPTDLCCRIEGINRVEKRLQIADSRLQTAK